MPPHQPETASFAHYLSAAGAALDAHLAAPPGDAMRRLGEWETLREPLPRHGSDPEEVLATLLEQVLPNGPPLTTPRAWPFVTTGPTTLPTVAATVASVASPQRYLVTAFNLLEGLSLEWLAELFGLGRDVQGVYSSGGSTANLVALGAARQWALAQRGIDASADGLITHRMAIYASTRAHHTVHRAAGVLGVGRRNVVPVAVDRDEQLDLPSLRAALEAGARAGVVPVAVVASAGTTDTGSIDPLRGAGELAREFGAWFHVDGAYGLPGVLDERVRDRYDGLELADSVIVDPHKWLNAPVGVAATFVRDGRVLQDAFSQGPADYLEGSFNPEGVEVSIDSIGVPYQDLGVELSAPARGVQVWAILRELGVEGVRARIVADDDLARLVADRVRAHPRLELLLEPTLSIVCFRYRPPDLEGADAVNQRILRRLHRETDLLPTSTVVAGAFAIRPCFINPRTRPADAEALVEAVVRLGDELVSESDRPR